MPSYIWGALLIGVVGLWDDFVTRFSPIARLSLVLTISSVTLASAPEFAAPSRIQLVTVRFKQPVWLILGGTLIVTGFVNAGNIADGANGLLGSIALSFLCCDVA